MVAFIDEHRQYYGVESICKVLPIAPATYYAHRKRRLSPEERPARTKSDEALRVEIKCGFRSDSGIDSGSTRAAFRSTRAAFRSDPGNVPGAPGQPSGAPGQQELSARF